eukprot:c15516_g1_i1.p1 GENE.c15516_g1_i1~~c15516_g1_i1.p1  ORF type:complete len:299 (-),score=77.74 c15516_g1_i1:124-963(-)
MALTTVNYINFVAYLANLIVTYLSMTGIFGETNNVVSEKYQTLITPAGWAFSIWGLIFIAEGAFAIAQLFPKYSSNPLVTSTSVVASWTLACVFQIAWTLAFAQEAIALSAVLLTAIWISLAVLVFSQQKIVESKNTDALDYGLLVFPFRIHFGWLTAATVVGYNIVAVRYYVDNATLQLAFAVTSLVALALFAGLLNSNNTLSGVLAWAIGAVSSELSKPEAKISTRFGDVIVNGIKEASAVVAIVLAVFTFVSFVVGLFGKKQRHNHDGASIITPLI